MEKPRFAFHPLTEADLPLLCDWLHRPHLQQWWRSGAISPDEVRDKYLPSIAGRGDARPYLAYLDSQPAGYIQYYRAAEGSDDWWPDVPGPGVLGIDQLGKSRRVMPNPVDLYRYGRVGGWGYGRRKARPHPHTPIPPYPLKQQLRYRIGYHRSFT